jgi:DNA-binding MarR family transcriptional regulator
MDATAQGRAMALLGRFNDDLTRVFDATFGTQWAEIEEMLAIAAIATDPRVTTRRLAEITRMNRRTVSRMILRMQQAGLIVTRPALTDRRAVEISFSTDGDERLDMLRTAITDFFVASRAVAREIGEGLGGQTYARAEAALAEPLALLLRVCAAGLALVRAMPDAASEGRLAARQRAALVHIATTGGARPQDLSEALELSRAGVAYVVDQLCAKGFAIRRRGVIPEDRRAVVVEATPEGMGAVQSVMKGIERQRETLADLFSEVAAWHPPTGARRHAHDGTEAPTRR